MTSALVLVAALQLAVSGNPILNPENAVPDHQMAVSDTLNSYVTIDNIVLLGNNVTKDRVILRELDVKRGQIVHFEDLKEKLELEQQKVNNLRLFNTVDVEAVRLDNERVLIVVEVSERWYIFPVPLFDIVDRNFNVWWDQQNADFNRVNYGLKLYQTNFRGRNERLRLTVQFGFTKKFGINYSIPYLDKNQRHGLIIDADYAENKNIGVRTRGHVQEFFDSEEVLRTRTNAGVTYVYRGEYFNFHYVSMNYYNTRVRDTVLAINPNYFKNGETQQQFFNISYQFVRDRRDVQAYPLDGYYATVGLHQLGLGIFNDISQTELRAKYSKYIDLKKGFYLSNHTSGYISFPKDQPYYNYSGMGYSNDFVRGYELYLIEGPSFLLNKTTFKKRILSIDEKINNFPIRQFRHFPLDIYLKSYVDFGYVENFQNYGDNVRFSDEYLAGGGLGLDIHTLYDMVFRMEYSVNKDQEHGFYFHVKKEF